MFTGLVEALGRLVKRAPDGHGGCLLTITMPFADQLRIGDSVAINGACLTVVDHDDRSAHFQAGPETLARTNLGLLDRDNDVNLERSLRLGDRLGGHLVQGHVDGLAQIAQRIPQGEWETVHFTCEPHLTDAMVPKGSVALEGVSLTLVDVSRGRFSVALIPHTRTVTTLGSQPVGWRVNVETELIGKYVAQALRAYRERSS